MLRKIREMLKCQKGFTLVELMAVIAIIGVLAAIAVPRFLNTTNNANVAKVQADLRTIDSAVAVFTARSNGVLPANVAALVPNEIQAAPVPPAAWVPANTTYTLNATGAAQLVMNRGTVTSASTTAEILAAR